MDDIVSTIQQKFTSHNEFAIDRITISEEEYLQLAGSKKLPRFIPERLIITIERNSVK